MTDALSQIVGEARDVAPGPPPADVAARPTLAPRLQPPGARGFPVARVLVAAGVLVLVLLAGLGTWRYRAAAGRLDVLVEEARTAVADGNHASRAAQAARLAAEGGASDPLAGLGDVAARLFGGDGLDLRRARRIALLARLEAERVGIYGESTRTEVAEQALAHARERAATHLDTHVATVLLLLHARQPGAAREALDALPDELRNTADAQFLYARAALAEGKRTEAVDRARTAAQLDDRHLHARALLVELKAARGDHAGAIEDYQALLGSLSPTYLGARIALERLRIQVDNRAAEAVAALKLLLRDAGDQLAPTERALAHDSLGLYYANSGDLEAARDAYRAAMEAAPDDPRFSTGLARLDIREFKLDAAEQVLQAAAAAEPGTSRHRVQLALVRLLRGDPAGALEQLSGVEKPDAEALLVRARAQLDLEDARAAEDTLAEATRLDGGLLDVRIYRTLAAFLQGRRRAATLADLRALRERRADGEQRLLDRTLAVRAYAAALAENGDVDPAIAEFQNAVVIDRRDFLAFHSLCRLRARKLEAREALRDCRAALEVNPHYLPAAALGAEIAEAGLDAGAVIAVLEPVLRTRTGPPPLVRRLARAYVDVGEPDKALTLLEGEHGTRDDPTRRYVKGLVAAAAGRLKEALEQLYPVTEQLTDDSWAQLAYAETLMKAGKGTEAAAFYRRAMSAGADPRAALGAAAAALKQNDWREAWRAAEAAEERAGKTPAHPRVRAEALAIQGQAWLQSGNRAGQKKAEKLLQRALEIEPDLPSALVAQGLLAELDRDLETAAARYQRATQVAPDDPEAFFRLGRLLFNERATRGMGRDALKKVVRMDPEGPWGVRAKKQLEE